MVQQVLNSKSRDRIVGLGGGVKLKDIRGPQPTRENLQDELTASKKQNEVLINSMELIQEENKRIQDENKQLVDRMSSMESRMQTFQELLATQFNLPNSS